MKAKISIALSGLLLALGLTVGCTKSGSNDAQLIGQVATKIQADGSLQTKAIAIQSNNGVVTLSGQVATDAERNQAAADAAQVEGVKTVVNNLTVANAAATPAPEPQPQQVEEPKHQPVKSSARRRETPSSPKASSASGYSAPAPSPSNSVAQNTPAPVSAPLTPPPPPKPSKITVPDGTQIAIRLVDPLDSEKNQIGDRFRATVAHSISVGDQVVIPVGSDIEGRVVDVKGAAHFTGKSVLAVELTNLSLAGKNYELHTAEFRREGAARGKNTAEKVGGGAALGAIIGAIAGGGKGAAIGATVGAGAGGGVQAATKGQQIKFPTESVLNFQLASPVAVFPSSKADHSYRDQRPVLSDRTNNGNNNDYNDNDSNYSDNDSTDRPVLERRPPAGNDNSNNEPN